MACYMLLGSCLPVLEPSAEHRLGAQPRCRTVERVVAGSDSAGGIVRAVSAAEVLHTVHTSQPPRTQIV